MDDLAPYILRAEKGRVLFREGDRGEEMYFVHAGRVRIEKEVDGAPLLLAHMEKGDFFGEMSVLDGIARTATAVVEEDADLLRVDRANFEKVLKADIEIAVRMIRKYSMRLREANDKLELLWRDRAEIDSGIKEVLVSAKRAVWTGTPEAKTETPPEVSIRAAGGLVHEASGTVFTLSDGGCSIGRFDPVTGVTPDVDLTALDEARSVSRRHALVSVVNGECLLTEEVGVANGTFVGGRRIGPGEPCTLKDGMTVTFGTVALSFVTGSGPDFYNRL